MYTAKYNCVYINCPNDRNRDNKFISFFTFPVTDTERVKEWQINCGNESVAHMDKDELKAKVICENHFPPKYIVRNRIRKLLTKTAVPYKFNETNSETISEKIQDELKVLPKTQEECLEVGQHSKIYTRKRLPSNSETDVKPVQLLYLDTYTSNVEISSHSESRQSSSFVDISDTILKKKSPLQHLPKEEPREELMTLVGKEMYLKKKMNAKPTENCRRNKNKSFSLNKLLMNLHRSKFVKTFINMQLFPRKHSKWTKMERDLVLSLYLKSPSAYKFMLYNLQFILPPEKVVQSWLKLRHLKPGLNKDLINKLSIKAKTMTKQEKMIAVMFDEIKLKPQLEFDPLRDRIEGYEDLGGDLRSSNLANMALVFSIRSILYNWKMPLSFYVYSGSVNSVLLQKIVADVIKQLKAMTFNPLLLVCNQTSNNCAMLELLGGTQQNPVIDIQGHKIFTCFDPSYLLKSLRNNFTNTDLQIVINKMPISWTDVTTIYDTDHMSDQQIFSNTVAAVVMFSTEQKTSATSKYTAEFLEKINCIFKALKYRIIHDPDPNKNTLSIYNESTIDVLHTALKYLKQVEIFENNKLRTDTNCIQGFQWTINSILELWNHLKSIGVEYLLTECINQNDHKIFSSAVSTITPSAKHLRIAMQRSIHKGIQMEIRNLEFQDSQNRTDNNELFVERKENTFATTKRTSTNDKSEEKQSILQEVRKTPSYIATCSAVYIAGYLARRVTKEYKCDNCASNLLIDKQYLINSHEFFILSQNYCCDVNEIKCLQRPSDEFTNVTLSLLQMFNEIYSDHKCGENITKNVYDCLRTYLFQNYPNWNIQMQEHCAEHMEFILKLFINMNIFRCVRKESENCDKKTESTKPYRKIRVLQAELL